MTDFNARKHIESLIEKADKVSGAQGIVDVAGAAMKFTQAALNAANAILALREAEAKGEK